MKNSIKTESTSASFWKMRKKNLEIIKWWRHAQHNLYSDSKMLIFFKIINVL